MTDEERVKVVDLLLREIKVDIWDEGFEAGHEHARAVNKEWPEAPKNPYRKEK